MAKKLSLKVPYTPDFISVGIFCPIKDYRLCWMLNETIGYSFAHFGVFNILPQGSENIEGYNVFVYKNHVLGFRMFLLNNRNMNRPLFIEPAQLDYLMLIQADETRHNINETLGLIRSTPSVNAAYVLEKQLGKTADEVFYDFELFIAEVDNDKSKDE